MLDLIVTVPNKFLVSPMTVKSLLTIMKTDIETLKKNVLYPVGLRREEQFWYLCGSWYCLKLMPLKHREIWVGRDLWRSNSQTLNSNLQTNCSGPGPSKLWVFSRNDEPTVVLGIWWFHRVFFHAVAELACAFWISEARSVAVSCKDDKDRQPKSNCIASCSGVP